MNVDKFIAEMYF